MNVRDSVPNPRLAQWLVNAFVPFDEAESLLGDLHEEFLQVRSNAGVAAARQWYSRQVRKTVGHFFLSGLRRPRTLVAVIAGIVLLRLTHSAPDWLLSELTDKYLAYWSTHFSSYCWLLRLMWIEYLAASMFTGCLVALLARGCEMVATLAMALILCAMAVSSLAVVTATGHFLSFWGLIMTFMDVVAIVLGGTIIRRNRTAAIARFRSS